MIGETYGGKKKDQGDERSEESRNHEGRDEVMRKKERSK